MRIHLFCISMIKILNICGERWLESPPYLTRKVDRYGKRNMQYVRIKKRQGSKRVDVDLVYYSVERAEKRMSEWNGE